MEHSVLTAEPHHITDCLSTGKYDGPCCKELLASLPWRGLCWCLLPKTLLWNPFAVHHTTKRKKKIKRKYASKRKYQTYLETLFNKDFKVKVGPVQ